MSLQEKHNRKVKDLESKYKTCVKDQERVAGEKRKAVSQLSSIEAKHITVAELEENAKEKHGAIASFKVQIADFKEENSRLENELALLTGENQQIDTRE